MSTMDVSMRIDITNATQVKAFSSFMSVLSEQFEVTRPTNPEQEFANKREVVLPIEPEAIPGTFASEESGTVGKPKATRKRRTATAVLDSAVGTLTGGEPGAGGYDPNNPRPENPYATAVENDDEANAAPTQEETTKTEEPTTNLTLDTIRMKVGEVIRGNADKKEAAKAKLSEMGVVGVTSLQPDQFEEFYAFLTEL